MYGRVSGATVSTTRRVFHTPLVILTTMKICLRLQTSIWSQVSHEVIDYLKDCLISGVLGDNVPEILLC